MKAVIDISREVACKGILHSLNPYQYKRTLLGDRTVFISLCPASPILWAPVSFALSLCTCMEDYMAAGCRCGLHC